MGLGSAVAVQVLLDTAQGHFDGCQTKHDK